jgi:glycosyltransferase involved in cell wall biosynthesis
MSKVCIIIPVYNEANRLNQAAYLAHLAQERNHHLLFVNDGSTDQSQYVLEQLKANNPQQIDFLTLAHNQGKAEAIRQGFMQAYRQSFDFIGYFDADLATPLNQINLLEGAIDQNSAYQISIGSRVQLHGYKIERKATRHYLGRIFATLVSMLFGFTIYDTQCGAKLFTANSATVQLFDSPFISRWFFDIEIFVRWQKQQGKTNFNESVIEVPLHEWHEQGQSKLKWSDFLTSPYQLLRIKQKYHI